VSTLRVLVSGDKHLGLVSDGLPRLPEQQRILDHVVGVLEARDPDVYVDLGDLFDASRPAPDAVEAALLYSARVERWSQHRSEQPAVTFLAGNHDKPTRGVVHALMPLAFAGRWDLSSNPFAPVVDVPGFEVVGGATLLYLPFVTEWEARQREQPSAQAWLDRVSADALVTGRRVIAFAHLEVPGATIDAEDSRQRDVGLHVPDCLLESDQVARVFCGHVHRYQELPKVTVVGSALHVDFGEAADSKGIIYAEVDL